MNLMTTVDLMQAFCRSTGKYAMYISFSSPDVADDPFDLFMSELALAAPYLGDRDPQRIGEILQIIADEHGVLVFDTEDEMRHYYDLTVGDDGPTVLNPYNGRIRVYALTCGPTGPMNENT